MYKVVIHDWYLWFIGLLVHCWLYWLWFLSFSTSLCAFSISRCWGLYFVYPDCIHGLSSTSQSLVFHVTYPLCLCLSSLSIFLLRTDSSDSHPLLTFASRFWGDPAACSVPRQTQMWVNGWSVTFIFLWQPLFQYVSKKYWAFEKCIGGGDRGGGKRELVWVHAGRCHLAVVAMPTYLLFLERRLSKSASLPISEVCLYLIFPIFLAAKLFFYSSLPCRVALPCFSEFFTSLI